MRLPRSWAIERIGELPGTSRTEPSGLALSAPTIAMLSAPAAAKTGGALPTLPMSTAPAPMACSMGGPEVKSDQVTLNGSLWIRPAALSRACDPDPAWSPMCTVTCDRLVVRLSAPAPAGDEAAALPFAPALADEQPAAMSASSAAPAIGERARRGGGG